MKTINLYRVHVTPAAKGRRFEDRGFSAAFLTNPNKDEVVRAVVLRAEQLKKLLDEYKENEDLHEAEMADVKQRIDNLAVVLDILNAWKPQPHTVDVGHPIAVQVANVQVGTIKFESEQVFDVRV